MNLFIVFSEDLDEPLFLKKNNLGEVLTELNVKYGMEDYYTVFECVANCHYDPEVYFDETDDVFNLR